MVEGVKTVSLDGAEGVVAPGDRGSNSEGPCIVDSGIWLGRLRRSHPVMHASVELAHTSVKRFRGRFVRTSFSGTPHGLPTNATGWPHERCNLKVVVLYKYCIS